jgi:hypothetical protein
MTSAPTNVGKRWKWRVVTAGALLLGCTGVALLFFRHAEPLGPAIVVQPFSPSLPARPLPIPDRWIPRKWGWLWRAKEVVLGQRKVVTLQGNALGLPPDTAVLQKLGIPSRIADFTNESKTGIWILSSNELRSVREGLKAADEVIQVVVGGGTITMGEESQGRLMSWQSVPGWRSGMVTNLSAGTILDVYPVVHRHSVLASATLSHSRFVTNEEGGLTTETNLALTGRFEIPTGSGLLILGAPPEQTNASRFGFLLIPSVPGEPKH